MDHTPVIEKSANNTLPKERIIISIQYSEGFFKLSARHGQHCFIKERCADTMSICYLPKRAMLCSAPHKT